MATIGNLLAVKGPPRRISSFWRVPIAPAPVPRE
jgi:hypothetical protein